MSQPIKLSSSLLTVVVSDQNFLINNYMNNPKPFKQFAEEHDIDIFMEAAQPELSNTSMSDSLSKIVDGNIFGNTTNEKLYSHLSSFRFKGMMKYLKLAYSIINSLTYNKLNQFKNTGKGFEITIDDIDIEVKPSGSTTAVSMSKGSNLSDVVYDPKGKRGLKLIVEKIKSMKAGKILGFDRISKKTLDNKSIATNVKIMARRLINSGDLKFDEQFITLPRTQVMGHKVYRDYGLNVDSTAKEFTISGSASVITDSKGNMYIIPVSGDTFKVAKESEGEIGSMLSR